MPTSLYEANRRYAPSPSTIERILDSSLRGHVGVVLQLETVVVDLAQAVGYSFAILAGDLKQDTPTPTQIRDSLGGAFKDYAVSLGLNIPEASLPAVEHRWHTILSAVLEKLPVIARPGVGTLISELLTERNDLVVVSSLPIDIAKKVLGKSGLAALFEGRVPGDHLICRDAPATPQEALLQSGVDYGERYRSKLAVRCCGVLKRPPLLCVHMDGNHRHLLSAKRSGFNAVALTGEHCTLSTRE
jgi:phosphoglycolate phosphatase-like HAD superfamily hydrolase